MRIVLRGRRGRVCPTADGQDSQPTRYIGQELSRPVRQVLKRGEAVYRPGPYFRIRPQLRLHILTAGDDKHIDEGKLCVSFKVDTPVTVYVFYFDKLRVLPQWLKPWEKTCWKVRRSNASGSTLKGTFTLFTKDVPAVRITLYGNVSRVMAVDPEFRKNRDGKLAAHHGLSYALWTPLWSAESPYVTESQRCHCELQYVSKRHVPASG